MEIKCGGWTESDVAAVEAKEESDGWKTGVMRA